MKSFIGFIKLLRPLNIFQGGIAVLVSMSLFAPLPSWKRVLLALLIVWAYAGGGNALNDFFDAAIDRINRPGRPIPAGLVSRRQALIFAIGLFVSGTLLATPILSPAVALILLAALSILVAYSPLFKVRPLWGNLSVSVTLGMTFLFAAAVFGDPAKGIVPCALAFSFNFIREVLKDIQDIPGDSALGAQTLPVRYGIAAARKVVIGSTLALMAGALLPYLLKIYGIYYLAVLVLGVETTLAYVVYSIIRNPSIGNCGRLAQIMKGNVFCGLLAIFVGRY